MGWLDWFRGKRPAAPVVRAKYDAAQTTALNAEHWGMADSLSADAALSPEVRKKIRERARYEVANNCYAQGITRTHVNSIVGTGPRLQVLTSDTSLNQEVEERWAEWSAARRLPAKLRVLAASRVVDGEAFALLRNGPPVGNVLLDIEPFECDRVQSPYVATFDSNDPDGIRLDSNGQPASYYIMRRHPGDRIGAGLGGNDYETVSASSVLHLFRMDRPGQHRGVSQIAPALPLFAILRRWTHATLLSAEQVASVTLYLKTNTQINSAAIDAWAEIAVRHGTMMMLPEGWDVAQPKAEQPTTAYAEFKRAIVSEVCRCLNMPYNVGAADSAGHSYSSSRLDHQIYGKDLLVEQADFERDCLDRIFAQWVEEAILAGDISVGAEAAIARHEWHWDPLIDIDPQATAASRETNLRSGLVSIPTLYAEDGRDWRAEMAKQAESLGLTLEAFQTRLADVIYPPAAQPAIAAPTAPVASDPLAADSAPVAEFGGLSRLQWQRNRKAINDVLQELIAGTTTPAAAQLYLESIGLSSDKAAALITDAQDRVIDDPGLTASLKAARKPALYAKNTIAMTGPVEIKAASGGDPSGTIRIAAYSGGELPVKGFPHPVVVDVAGLEIPDQTRPILIDHDESEEGVLGQTASIQASLADGSIVATGQALGVSDKATRVKAMAASGYRWQASIGATVLRQEFIPSGASVQVNGRSFAGPIIVARKARLREISVVATGADDTTVASIAATAGESVMTFEQWLATLGVDVATINGAQKAEYQKAYDAVSKAASPVAAAAPAQPATPAAPTPVAASVAIDLKAAAVTTAVTDYRRQMAAEADRVAKVTKLTEGHAEIRAKAIGEGWDETKVQLEVLRASRSSGPSVFVPSAPESGPMVLQAALAQAGGLRGVDKHFDDKTLQAAHTRYKGRISLKQMLLEAAWNGGYTGQHFDTSATGIKGILKAAFTSVSLPGILSNNANKFLLEGFMAVEDAWKQISATRSVSDFKQVTSYRLTGNMEFDEVGPAGTITHGTLGEQPYTNQARTYAKMMAIPRETIINDDLGAMSDVPRMIGRGSALKLNSVFWAEFLADLSTFWTTARKNYFEGGTTNLSVDSLTTAERMFFDQTDPDGKPLGVSPTILLVPNALNVTASTLMKSAELRDTTASTKYLTVNPHAGKFDIVRSAYLSNTTITGNSTTAWWLLANPNDLPVIEVAFLNGQQTPTVEDSDADFDTLGIQMRGYFDFGVKKQEYRGGVRSKGAA